VAYGFQQLSSNNPDKVLSNVSKNITSWVPLAAAALGIVVIYCLIWWLKARFRYDDDALEWVTGVLFRKRRRVLLDRLQSVDIHQPLLGRLAGFAALRLEVAGGSDSHINLAYLTESRAAALRAELLARAAGLQLNQDPAPQAPENELLTIPSKRLISSVLLHLSVLLTPIWLACWIIPIAFTKQWALLLGLVSTLWTIIRPIVNKIQAGLNYCLANSPDGLRVTHGLLQLTHQTVPPGRIQAIRIEQYWLWRKPAWWTISINLAGYAGENSSTSLGGVTLLPVGEQLDVSKTLWAVRSELTQDTAQNLLQHLMTEATPTQANRQLVGAAAAARWLDPLVWRHRAYGVSPVCLMIRSGRWHKQIDLVPHDKIQSLSLAQGPLQRRLGLATVYLHSTQGPITPLVKHLSLTDAMKLLNEQSTRARTARQAARAERWMTTNQPTEEASNA
jgi:putative membrane protein